MLTVDVIGIHNLVSLDRVTLEKTGEEVSSSDTPTSSTSLDQGPNKEGSPPQQSAQDIQTREYTVNELADNQQYNGKPQYRVRWYGYAPAEDT